MPGGLHYFLLGIVFWVCFGFSGLGVCFLANFGVIYLVDGVCWRKLVLYFKIGVSEEESREELQLIRAGVRFCLKLVWYSTAYDFDLITGKPS